MMRIIIPITLAIGTLWIIGSAYSQTASQKNCADPYNCFYLDNYKLLPSGELTDYPQYASLGKRFHTGGERAFVFSPRYKRWGAYDKDGYKVAGGIANGGQHHCADLGRACLTPRGSFRIGRKGGAGCVSNKFPLGVGGSPMPYCMFFRGGYAIHGSPYISNRNGSHGCIRVHTHAAKWLSNNFLRGGTKVIVLPY